MSPGTEEMCSECGGKVLKLQSLQICKESTWLFYFLMETCRVEEKIQDKWLMVGRRQKASGRWYVESFPVFSSPPSG